MPRSDRFDGGPLLALLGELTAAQGTDEEICVRTLSAAFGRAALDRRLVGAPSCELEAAFYALERARARDASMADALRAATAAAHGAAEASRTGAAAHVTPFSADSANEPAGAAS